jgi:N-formylmaleamate deformylase
MITGLELHKPILLGHSMGAVTTLVMAGLNPDLPGAILLEDPPDWWMPAKEVDPQTAERFAMGIKWMTDLQSKPKKQIIAEQRAAAPGWSEAELGPWADSKLRFNPQVFSIFGPNPAAGVDWKKVLSAITCPALLITADPTLGSIVTQDSAKALKILVPQLKIANIPGAGHNIRREQFEAYLAAVHSFLDEPVN